MRGKNWPSFRYLTKATRAICIEMPSSKEVEALLKQLAKVAIWYNE